MGYFHERGGVTWFMLAFVSCAPLVGGNAATLAGGPIYLVWSEDREPGDGVAVPGIRPRSVGGYQR